MTIQTGITANRKALAAQISQELAGAPVTYAGVPSCAYRVGACVTIDRQGNIEITSADAAAILMPFFTDQGWHTDEPAMETTVDSEAAEELTETNPMESDAPIEPAEAAENNESDVPAIDEDLKALPDAPDNSDSTASNGAYLISIPAELTAAQLTNLVHMLYSQQRLLNKAAMDGRLTIPEALIARLTEYTPETPEAFSQLLNDFKAQGELAGFGYEDGVVTMDFPFDEAHPERWTAYAGLVGRILRVIKEATRVKAELQTSENEKYYMRAWLLRLGYGGADLKAERKLLLQKLNGHSAFPNDAAAQKHKEKYAALRMAGREANSRAE